MKRTLGMLGIAGAMALGVAACAPPAYLRTEVVYEDPPQRVYVADPDRVVVVTREVFVSHGWEVFRVDRDGPDRVIWARRGPDEIVRVFCRPDGERVAMRTVWEQRDRDDHGHRVWRRRGNAPDEVVGDIDVRLRGH